MMKEFNEFLNEGKSASSRLTSRLKSKGVDLNKKAKDRKAEHDKLKAKYAKEDALDEAPLVMKDSDILDSIWDKVKPELQKMLRSGNLETVNNFARIGKYRITKDKQSKGKTYRHDLK
tara:strand:- start:245 stop:598 length:354 start_codon:yes stop_codon:yes gene_type:complete